MKLTDEQKVFLAWLNRTDKIHSYEMIINKDIVDDKESVMYGTPQVAFRIFLDPSAYLHCVFTHEMDTIIVTEYHCTTRRIPSVQVGLINRFFSKHRLTPASPMWKGCFRQSKQAYLHYEEFMKVINRLDEKEFYKRTPGAKDSFHRAGGLY